MPAWSDCVVPNLSEEVAEKTHSAQTAALSPSATNNGNVYLWNVATSAPVASLYGPKGGVVQSIAFSPHGGILAATSDNDAGHKYVTCVWEITGNSSLPSRTPAAWASPGSGSARTAASSQSAIKR